MVLKGLKRRDGAEGVNIPSRPYKSNNMTLLKELKGHDSAKGVKKT